MPEIQESAELQGKLDFVRARVAQAFTEGKAEKDGKPVINTKAIKVYGEGMTDMAIVEKIREDNEQMNDLQKKVEAFGVAQKVFDDLSKPVKNILHPTADDGSGGQGPPQFKGLGQRIYELPWGNEQGGLKALLKRAGELEIPGVSIREFKTLFETGAGWEPESVRFPQIVEKAVRPIQILDIIPMGTIGQAAAKYMEETTRNDNAAEKAEGAAYAESEFVLTERTKPVEKITNSVPVTDEQLEDVAQAQSYLDGRIRFGIRQRLDSQMLVGDGNTPNLDGILNVSGIQTRAKGADPTPDAFFKAMNDNVLLIGRANATHHIIHPTNWSPIRLLRTDNGIYIWGSPMDVGPERLWGLPVVVSDAITLGIGLTGAFDPAWIQLLERRGIILELGFVADQFKEGKQTIRASMRAVLVTYRPAAFCTVTGLPSS